MVLTWILPNTLEDVLAIVLAGLAAYVALLNLPLRRGEAKAKLERVANNFIKVRPLPSLSGLGQHHYGNDGCMAACMRSQVDNEWKLRPRALLQTRASLNHEDPRVSVQACYSCTAHMRGLFCLGLKCGVWGIQEVEERLKAELESSLDACAVEVNGFIKPLEEATLGVVERIRDAESRRAALASQLEQLKQRAANIE